LANIANLPPLVECGIESGIRHSDPELLLECCLLDLHQIGHAYRRKKFCGICRRHMAGSAVNNARAIFGVILAAAALASVCGVASIRDIAKRKKDRRRAAVAYSARRCRWPRRTELLLRPRPRRQTKGVLQNVASRLIGGARNQDGFTQSLRCRFTTASITRALA
jgi:hypothetical protein